MRVLIVHNRYRQRGGEDAVFEAERDLLIANGAQVRTLECTTDDIPQGLSFYDGAKLAVGTTRSRRGAAAVGAAAEHRAEMVYFHCSERDPLAGGPSPPRAEQPADGTMMDRLQPPDFFHTHPKEPGFFGYGSRKCVVDAHRVVHVDNFCKRTFRRALPPGIHRTVGAWLKASLSPHLLEKRKMAVAYWAFAENLLRQEIAFFLRFR